MLLTVKDIGFKDYVEFSQIGKIIEIVNYFSCELQSGKCYCFESDIMKGAWGLSWIIAGEVNQSEGEIICNDKEMTKSERRKISQLVGLDAFDFHTIGERTIEKQIIKGLKETKNKNANSLEEIRMLFDMPKEKIDRTIEHVSAMRYRASMAIGYAYNKIIYCFPWMQPYHLECFQNWIGRSIDILKKKDCIVIIPTNNNEKINYLFDEVIKIVPRQPILS